MESIVRNVKDIENEERRFYESVLREQLRDNQRVFIMVLDPGAQADEAIRRKAMADAMEIARKGSESRERQGVSVEEADRLVDEAIEHVRRHKDE